MKSFLLSMPAECSTPSIRALNVSPRGRKAAAPSPRVSWTLWKKWYQNYTPIFNRNLTIYVSSPNRAVQHICQSGIILRVPFPTCNWPQSIQHGEAEFPIEIDETTFFALQPVENLLDLVLDQIFHVVLPKPEVSQMSERETALRLPSAALRIDNSYRNKKCAIFFGNIAKKYDTFIFFVP